MIKRLEATQRLLDQRKRACFHQSKILAEATLLEAPEDQHVLEVLSPDDQKCCEFCRLKRVNPSNRVWWLIVSRNWRSHSPGQKQQRNNRVFNHLYWGQFTLGRINSGYNFSKSD